ncbi:MAG: hypothetical protein AB7F19_03565 [Candidatus Babeliales bacterium]
MHKSLAFPLCLFLSLHVHVQAMEGAKPFTPEEFAQHHWPMPANACTFTGYWTAWELEQDSTAQRLRVSPFEVRDAAAQQIVALDTLEKQYKAACCASLLSDYRLVDVLKSAADKNLHRFVATVAPYKPNVNHLAGCWRTEKTDSTLCQTRTAVPLFFLAQTKKMAKWFWILGANYKELEHSEGGTVLHHICAQPSNAPQETLKLMKFYIARGVPVDAVDTKGRTPLHRVALNRAGNTENYLLPVTLFLIKHGALLNLKDAAGSTCRDYLEAHKFQPDAGDLACRIVLAHLDALAAKPPSKQYPPCNYQDMHCIDHQDVELIEREITPADMKSCLPLVPEECDDMSCKALYIDPRYARARKLLDYKRGNAKPCVEVVEIINQEIARILSEWRLARIWLALNVALRYGDLFDSTDFNRMITHAFLENDCAFIELLLRHKYKFEIESLFIRSEAMFQLLKKYRALPYESMDTFVFGVQHATRLPQGAVEYFAGSRCLDEARQRLERLKRLELLTQNSYRFESKLNELIWVAKTIWGHEGVSVYEKNPETGKSIADLARATHKLWNLPVTKMFAEFIFWQHAARTYAEHGEPIP